MLTEAKLPESFWTYALGAYRHVHNRTPTSALTASRTPFEAYKHKKPCVGHLRVFGCAAYVLIGRNKCRGMQGHAVSGIFIGYLDNYVGWHIYLPSTKKVIVSRDVIFNETCFPRLSLLNAPPVPSVDMFDNLEEYPPYDSDEAIAPQAEPASPASMPVNRECAFDDGEPLTDIESDATESVGVTGGDTPTPSHDDISVGATGGNTPMPPHDNVLVGAEQPIRTQAPRQPKPPLPPREPSQCI